MASNVEPIEGVTFEASCFPGPPNLDRFGGSTPGTVYQPVQYSPHYYGENVDLWDISRKPWRYVKTLQVDKRSGFCGTHHLSTDLDSAVTFVDVKACSPNRQIERFPQSQIAERKTGDQQGPGER